MSLDIYELMQNPALGTCCISKFIESYSSIKGRGPKLPLTMVVLPIVFHRQSVDILQRRALSGGLLNAKVQNPTLGAGLQERMVEMTDQTLKSVSMGLTLGLFGYNPVTCDLIALRAKIEGPKFPTAVRPLIWTADRLGRWMAEMQIPTFCSHLNITF